MKIKALSLAILLGACFIPVHAADKGAKAPSDAELDAIVKRLEDSGRLDTAFDRAVERYNQRQQEAKRKYMEDQQAAAKAKNKNVRKPDPARDHIFGNKDAEVTMIEFSDYECPFCKRFHGTPEALVKKFEGRVNLVWRHFPLPFHNPMAMMEAEAAECIAQQKGEEAFWKFTDTVMAKSQTNGKGLPPTADGEHPLMALAGELGADKTAFNTCMDESRGNARVDQDLKDGVDSGIEGTPGIIIYNNKTGKTEFANGAIPQEKLEQLVRSVLSPQ